MQETHVTFAGKALAGQWPGGTHFQPMLSMGRFPQFCTTTHEPSTPPLDLLWSKPLPQAGERVEKAYLP